MNLIKELLVLKEEDTKLKVPSFGDMQKAIYAVALPFYLNAQDKKALGDLSLGVLQNEARNDRFWTSSFDYAFSTLEKFAAGKKEIDDIVEAIGEAFDQVIDNIDDYYSNQWNFEPGTNLPKLKHPGEVDGSVLEKLVYDMVPGAKELVAASDEHRGVVNAMHRDFVKLANRQRQPKE